MPVGYAGAVAAGIGDPATLLLAGRTLMCLPNLVVAPFVPEVRALRRRDEPEPALSPL